MLLYDVNSSKYLSVPFWKYDRFSLDDMKNGDCISELRFEKEDLFFYMVSFKYLIKQLAITELLFLALKLCGFA